MKALIFVFLLAAGAAAAAEPRPAIVGNFDAVDRNRDGQLSWPEFRDRVMDMFYFADLDNDGLIGRSEAPRGLQRHWQDFQRDGDDRVGADAFVAFHRTRFDQADGNRDDQLSREEVDGLPRQGEGRRRR